MEIEGSLGHSDIEILVRANSRITTLNLKKADFSLFRDLRDLFGKIPWDIVLKRSPRELFDS